MIEAVAAGELGERGPARLESLQRLLLTIAERDAADPAASAGSVARVTDFSIADDLSLALALAAEADLISIDRFRALDLVVTTKPDRTPVTDADQAVERVIRDGLAAARPGDAVYGEEFGTEGDSARQWIIDPIDGTANFLRGVPDLGHAHRARRRSRARWSAW